MNTIADIAMALDRAMRESSSYKTDHREMVDSLRKLADGIVAQDHRDRRHRLVLEEFADLLTLHRQG